MLISIVVPTYRRPRSLQKLLRSISVQTLKEPFEVLVVDDGGGGLQQVVEPFQERFSLRLLTQPNFGPAQARNHGAKYATGTRLVFFDDDCVPEDSCLQRIVEAHAQYPKAAIGGTTKNILTENIYSSASQLLLDFLYDYFQTESTRGNPFFTTNNLSIPRQEFVATGGFDTGFSRAAGEDREFADRWKYRGGELVFDPRIVVGHAHPLSLPSFVRQHFKYGTAARRYWYLKSLREGQNIKLESFRFYSRLIFYPLVRFDLTSTTGALVLLFALSQVMNAFGYFATSRPTLDTHPQLEPSGSIAHAAHQGPTQSI